MILPTRALLLSPVWLAACATAGTFQTADTLGRGGWEAGGDVSGLWIADSASSDTPLIPAVRGVARVGLSDRVDLGGSLGLDGLRVGPKFELTKQNAPVILSFAPGVRVLPIPAPEATRVLFGLEQAVLIGAPITDTTQVVVTPRLAEDMAFVDGRAIVLAWAGGSVGFSWQASSRFRLMPEVGWMAPFLVVDGGEQEGAAGGVLQAGVGAVFGKRSERFQKARR